MPKIGDYYAELGVKGMANVTGAFAGVRNGLTRMAASAVSPIRGFGSSLLGLLSPIGLVTTAIGSLGAGLSVGKILSAYAESEDAGKRLEQVVKATGGAAGFTADQLSEMASDFQNLTTYEDDATKQAMSMLLTFKSIKGDTFRDTMEAAMDLSTVFGQDIQGSVTQLGKALEDPIQGLSALRRVGVSFSDQEKETIKGLVETNRLADAQRLILKAIGGQVGGSARAAVGTLGGQFKQAKNAIGDVFEDLGKMLSETFDLPGVTAGIKQFAQSFTGTYGPGIKAFLVSIRDAFLSWLPVIKQVFSTLIAWWGVLLEVAGSILGAIGSFFSSVFGGMGGDVREWIMAFLTMLEFWFTNWKTYLAIAYETLALSFSNMWERIKALFQNGVILIQWFAGNWKDILYTTVDYVSTLFVNLGNNIRNLWSGVLDFIRGRGFTFDWTPLAEGFVSTVKKMPQFVDAAVKDTTPALDVLKADLEKAREEFYAKKAEKPAGAEATKPGALATPGAPSPLAAVGAAKSAAAGISFVGLAQLANQMQEEAGKLVQEQIAKASEKSASALDELAQAAGGNGLRVQIVGGAGGATYA